MQLLHKAARTKMSLPIFEMRGDGSVFTPPQLFLVLFFFCFSPFYALHSCPLSPLIDVRTLRCISALQDAPTLVCICLLRTRRPASPTSCKIQAARIDCAAHRGRIKAERVFFSDWLPQLRTILAAVGRKWNLNFFLVYGSIGNKIDFRGSREKKQLCR